MASKLQYDEETETVTITLNKRDFDTIPVIPTMQFAQAAGIKHQMLDLFLRWEHLEVVSEDDVTLDDD